MTEAQKLLALEAALTACGVLIPLEAKESIYKFLDTTLSSYDELGFGTFIDDQKEACLALAIWTSEGGI
jgi:hypothetical protein